MKSISSICACFLALSCVAQIPPGYYDSAQGLNGQPLRSALHNIIDNHDAQSYGSLWIFFQQTDNKGGNTVWDIYSDVPGGAPAYSYQFGSDQCGSYGAEGDCFNREHTFPQSWYGSGNPMKSDLFHVYPSDGFVNGARSNDPYGEVDGAFFVSTNGSLSGPNTFPGYIGNVFEPIDEYKGDLARNYFYMMTRYMDISGGWGSPMLSNGDLIQWAVNLLVTWHQNDPVSTKELDRNNAVYGVQDNRNPFIDHPEWVEDIWINTTAIGEQIQTLQARVFYSNGQVHIGSEQGLHFMLLSANGQELLQREISGKAIIDVDLPSGLYIVVLSRAGQFYAQKVMVDGS